MTSTRHALAVKLVYGLGLPRRLSTKRALVASVSGSLRWGPGSDSHLLSMGHASRTPVAAQSVLRPLCLRRLPTAYANVVLKKKKPDDNQA